MTRILLFISFLGVSLTMASDAQAQYRTSGGRRHYDSGRQQGGNGYHKGSDGPQNIIKINPVPIIFGEYGASYERGINSNMSVGLNASILNYS